MIRFLKVKLVCFIERRAYRNRHKSFQHFADWARLNNLRYRVLYPDAIQSAW